MNYMAFSEINVISFVADVG